MSIASLYARPPANSLLLNWKPSVAPTEPPYASPLSKPPPAQRIGSLAKRYPRFRRTRTPLASTATLSGSPSPLTSASSSSSAPGPAGSLAFASFHFGSDVVGLVKFAVTPNEPPSEKPNWSPEADSPWPADALVVGFRPLPLTGAVFCAVLA